MGGGRRTTVVSFSAKEDILSYRYVKLLRQFLTLQAAWPYGIFGVKESVFIRFYRKLLPVLGSTVILGQMLFIYEYNDKIDFFQKGYCYLVMFLTITTCARLTLPNFKSYEEIIRYSLLAFHLGHIKSMGQYHRQISDSVQRMSTIFTVYLIITCYVSLFLYNLAPLYLNYRNGFYTGNRIENATYECIVCCIIPGILDTSEFSLLETSYSLYLTTYFGAVCCSDCLILLMVFQIIGHILILGNDLETLPKPKAAKKDLKVNFRGEKLILNIDGFEKFDVEENRMIQRELVGCIGHHKMIVFFTNDMSKLFGPIFGLNYATNLVTCSILLLECSGGGLHGILRFGTLSVLVFGQLIMISVIFEILNTVSEKLKDSIYSTPWEYMDTNNRRTVLIMLIKMQRPIEVTAMGITKVGVAAMAQILKATISYYTLLRSFNE